VLHQFLREAGLADAGLAGEEKETPPAGERILEAGDQLCELAAAPDEGAAGRLCNRVLSHG
jgi:hypothetical protein